jgi:hypothetical protein
MAYDYGRLADKAAALVEKYGRAVTLVKTSRTPADAAAPWDGPSETSTTSASAYAVFPEIEESDTDSARRGTRTALVTVDSSVSVDEYDYLSDGGELTKITSVRPLKPGPTTILYTLTLEG